MTTVTWTGHTVSTMAGRTGGTRPHPSHQSIVYGESTGLPSHASIEEGTLWGVRVWCEGVVGVALTVYFLKAVWMVLAALMSSCCSRSATRSRNGGRREGGRREEGKGGKREEGEGGKREEGEGGKREEGEGGKREEGEGGKREEGEGGKREEGEGGKREEGEYIGTWHLRIPTTMHRTWHEFTAHTMHTCKPKEPNTCVRTPHHTTPRHTTPHHYRQG